MGNQAKNGPVCLEIKQQILKFTANGTIVFSPFFAVGPLEALKFQKNHPKNAIFDVQTRGWAIIKAWAIIKINTVSISYEMADDIKK